MRVSTYVLGVAAAFGATAMGFAGCGGTVSTENAGGTTGGGMGGATTMVTVAASVSSTTTTTTSASSSSSSSSTTTTTSSSSSSGGDAACDAACAHIAQCGLGITCAQLPANFNCSTVGTQYDCLFNCAAQTPCADFGAGTLQACQAQCATDGGVGPGDGGVGPGDGGTAANTCKTCVPSQCTSAIAPCAQDATCQPWLACTLGCIQANPPVESCFQACDANNASASALYTPVWDCACTSCATECAAVNPCDHGVDGGP